MINWNQMNTVLLDMDGTLLDLHFDNQFWLKDLPKAYALQQNISQDAALEIILEKMRGMRGQLKWYCMEHWQDYLQMDFMPVKERMTVKPSARPNAINFLQNLRHQDNLHILLVTNAHPTNLRYKLDHVPIEPYFHQIVSSHEYGAAKEALGFWQELQT